MTKTGSGQTQGKVEKRVAFLGMNAVGVEIENPFGDDDNDLPIKKMMKRIELDTGAMLELRGMSDQAAAMEAYRQEKHAREAEEQEKREKAAALGGRGRPGGKGK